MSYEIPSDERDLRLARKDILRNRELSRFSPAFATQVDSSGVGAGSKDYSQGVILGNLVMNPEVHFEGVEIAWTGGSDNLRVGDFIDSSVSAWQGTLLHIVSGNGVAGTGVFEPNNATNITDVNQTLSKSGWSATYTTSTLKNGRVVTISASLIIDTRDGSEPTLEALYGAKADGQLTTIKPKEGKTLTILSGVSGGNIDIASDVVITDTGMGIMQFHADNITPDAGGNWVVSSGSGSGSFPILYPEDDLGIVGGTSILIDISGDTGHFKQMELNGDIELGFTNPPASDVFFEFWVQITQDGVGGHSIIGTDVNLKNGADLDGLLDKAIDAVTVFHFTTGDGGASYHGELVDLVSGGEVFTWTDDHVADGFDLVGVHQIEFWDDNTPTPAIRGWISGEQGQRLNLTLPANEKFYILDGITDMMYFNKFGINQVGSVGGGGVPLPIDETNQFITLANDNGIGWRNSDNQDNASFVYNASDQFVFHASNGLLSNDVLTMGVNVSGLPYMDFEQSDVTRVGNIDAYTGNHDIGSVDPFHEIHGEQFNPVAHSYFGGDPVGLKKGSLQEEVYIDTDAITGIFDIRQDGFGSAGTRTNGSAPWFRFQIVSGFPSFTIYSQGGNQARFHLGGILDAVEQVFIPSTGSFHIFNDSGFVNSKITLIPASGKALDIHNDDGVKLTNMDLDLDGNDIHMDNTGGIGGFLFMDGGGILNTDRISFINGGDISQLAGGNLRMDCNTFEIRTNGTDRLVTFDDIFGIAVRHQQRFMPEDVFADNNMIISAFNDGSFFGLMTTQGSRGCILVPNISSTIQQGAGINATLDGRYGDGNGAHGLQLDTSESGGDGRYRMWAKFGTEWEFVEFNSTAGGSGANIFLSNLSPNTAINENLHLNATKHIIPLASPSSDLGTSVFKFRTLYVDTVVGNLGNFNQVNTNIIFAGSPSFTGTVLDIHNQFIFLGLGPTSSIIFPNGRWGGDLDPNSTNLRDLGSESLRWRTGHFQQIRYDGSHRITLDSSAVRLFTSGFGDRIAFHDGGSDRWWYDYSTDELRPLDGVVGLGGSSWRYVDVWAFDSSINTSFTEFKQDIVVQPDEDCLEACTNLIPIKFRWKDELFSDMKEPKKSEYINRVNMGFNADSMKVDVPEAVMGDVGKEGIKSQAVIALLIGSVRHLKARIETLEQA